MALEDRGPARFRFVGRREVRQKFADFLYKARKAGRGSTYVIQGPPGAGKTALWHQLVKEAEERGWHCAEIYRNALYSPSAMAEKTGLDATVGESKQRSTEGEGGVDMGIVKGKVQHGRNTAKAYAGTSIDSLLRALGQK